MRDNPKRTTESFIVTSHNTYVLKYQSILNKFIVYNFKYCRVLSKLYVIKSNILRARKNLRR